MSISYNSYCSVCVTLYTPRPAGGADTLAVASYGIILSTFSIYKDGIESPGFQSAEQTQLSLSARFPFYMCRTRLRDLTRRPSTHIFYATPAQTYRRGTTSRAGSLMSARYTPYESACGASKSSTGIKQQRHGLHHSRSFPAMPDEHSRVSA